MDWPKKPTQWIQDRTLYISIPFTWNLPKVKVEISQMSFFWDKVVIGGPAVSLMPDFFNDVEYVSVGPWRMPGVLQRVNPLATKTTMGCIRRCKYCAVPKIESPYFKGGFKELDDWPDLPIICDNNLLAASIKHFDKVIDRAKHHEGVDFNQGIDARLLRKHHADRFAEIKKPIIRLALDSMEYVESWVKAYRILRNAGLPKKAIRSYALIGFNSGPEEAWQRCVWISDHGICALPMWYHSLDSLESNYVSANQEALGWIDFERKLIMQYYYQRGKRRAMILKDYGNRLQGKK